MDPLASARLLLPPSQQARAAPWPSSSDENRDPEVGAFQAQCWQPVPEADVYLNCKLSCISYIYLAAWSYGNHQRPSQGHRPKAHTPPPPHTHTTGLCRYLPNSASHFRSQLNVHTRTCYLLTFLILSSIAFCPKRSLGCTVGLHGLSILSVIVCIDSPHTPSPSHSLPPPPWQPICSL